MTDIRSSITGSMLYKKLEIFQSEIEHTNCCTQSLECSDDDIELVENNFELSSSLNEGERSSLY